MQLPVFACKQCGHCCKGHEEALPAGMTADGLIFCNPLHLLVESWEKESFPVNSVVPLSGYYDLRTDSLIVLRYTTTSSTCPNLKENACQCYGKHPLLCKGYPINGMASIRGDEIGINLAYCPAEASVDQLLEYCGIQNTQAAQQIDHRRLLSRLIERYGMLVGFSLAQEHLTYEINDEIQRRIQSHTIIPATYRRRPRDLAQRLTYVPRIDAVTLYEQNSGLQINQAYVTKLAEDFVAQYK